MLVMNTLPERGRPLEAADASTLGPSGADAAQRWLRTQAERPETPLLELGVGWRPSSDSGDERR